MNWLMKYLAIAIIQAKTESAYMANLVTKGLVIGLRIWILSQLYEASFSSGMVSKDGEFTKEMVIWAVILTQTFGIVTSYELGRFISDDVKRGDIAYSLLRPISYPLQQFASFWGKSVPTLLWGGSVSITVGCLLAGWLGVSVQGLLWGALLFIMGTTIHFLISLSIGLLAFWTEDVSAFRWIYQKLYIMLGGMILPPAIFPDWLKGLVERLPFSQLFYAAAETIVNFNLDQVIKYLSMQLFWITIMGGVSYFLYSQGVKRVSQNGG